MRSRDIFCPSVGISREPTCTVCMSVESSCADTNEQSKALRRQARQAGTCRVAGVSVVATHRDRLAIHHPGGGLLIRPGLSLQSSGG